MARNQPNTMTDEKLEKELERIIAQLEKKGLLPKMNEAEKKALISLVAKKIQEAGGISPEKLKDPAMQKTLGMILVTTFTLEKHPELKAKYSNVLSIAGIALLLAGKDLKESNQLTPELKKQFELQVLSMLMLVQDGRKLNSPAKDGAKAHPDDFVAAAKEAAFELLTVYDNAGNAIEKSEGNMRESSKAHVTIAALLATEGEEPLERALEQTGIIKDKTGDLFSDLASTAVGEDNAYKPKSPFDGMRGPKPPGVID